MARGVEGGGGAGAIIRGGDYFEYFHERGTIQKINRGTALIRENTVHAVYPLPSKIGFIAWGKGHARPSGRSARHFFYFFDLGGMLLLISYET